jgi:hypothetical protein
VKESYNVGDTIWIEMNFSDVFTLRYPNLQNTNEYFTTTTKLENFDFHRNFFRLFKLENNEIPAFSQPYAWNEIHFHMTEGIMLTEENTGVEFKMRYSSGQYLLKASVILQTSGNYLFSPHFRHKFPASSFGANEQDITPECKTKEMIYDIEFPINRQSDGSYLTNYHIFEQHMNPALETDLDRIKNRCFTFKVN